MVPYYGWSSTVSGLQSHYEETVHPIIALKKLWKILFVSSKKLFSFSRYSHFCISILTSFSFCQPLLEMTEDKSQSLWCHQLAKQEFKNTYCLILEKEARSDIEIWSSDAALSKKHFYGKSMQKCAPKVSFRPLNRQPKTANVWKNSFENVILKDN